MGRTLLILVKTILTAVIVCGMVIASFYFAYLLLILLVLGVVGALTYFYSSRETVSAWFEYEDTE